MLLELLVFSVVFSRSLFVLNCPFSFGHCVVCPLLYGYWLNLWYLQIFLVTLNVFERWTWHLCLFVWWCLTPLSTILNTIKQTHTQIVLENIYPEKVDTLDNRISYLSIYLRIVFFNIFFLQGGNVSGRRYCRNHISNKTSYYNMETNGRQRSSFHRTVSKFNSTNKRQNKKYSYATAS